jgi:hypothetical protein
MEKNQGWEGCLGFADPSPDWRLFRIGASALPVIPAVLLYSSA